MREGWAKTLFLYKKLDARFQDVENKINSVITALTNITLSVSGTGSGLVGTTVRVTKGSETLTGQFDASLRLSFQLTSLGTYTVTYQHTSAQTATVQVVISDYGYYEAKVAYFPGYDLWDYWAGLAGISSSRYPSIEQMLMDDLARLSLMSSSAAIDYMIASTGGRISGAVLSNGDAVKALIRSPYALQKLKGSTYWRTALLNSIVAVTTCYAIKGELKSQNINANVVDIYAGNRDASGSATKNMTIEDSNMLLIAYTNRLGCSASDNGISNEHSGAAHYANTTGRIIINGTVTVNRSVSVTIKQGEYSSTATDVALSYNKAEKITSISVYNETRSFGASADGNTEAVFYYL